MADTITLPSSLQYAQRDLDAAYQQYRVGVAALYRPDGAPLYADAEHKQRHDALLDTFRRDVDTVLTTAQEQQDAARQMLTRAAGYDPLDHLSGDDLARARHLAHFAREDADDLPLPEFAARLAAVAADRDAVRRALYVRYAGRRLARETDRARNQPRTQDDLEALSAVRQHLDTLRGSTHADAQTLSTTAEAIKQAAGQLDIDARRRLAEADGRLDAHKQAARERYRRMF